jgi:predicted Zn-dependent peptidase
LPNGLEIVAECCESAYSTAVGYFVRTGSRDEPEALAGVSHFLEHMVFKGTPRRSVDDVNREFDEMGAHYNACTGEEATIYYAAVLPECQDRVVELWADVLRPSLREEDFETEKQVILEEIDLYLDMPPFGADDKCKEFYFGDHPLAKSVIGTPESIKGMDVAMMRDYFQKWYSPSNITIVATGNVDFDSLVKTAEAATADWETFETNRVHRPSEGCQCFEVIEKESASQEYAIHLSPGPGCKDEDRYIAKLAGVILGDETGSRLYWELIDTGRAEHASLTHYEYEDVGIMATYLACDPELVEENLATIWKVYEETREDGITDEEFEQARSKVRSRIVLASERPRDRLFAVGSDWLLRREHRTVEDDLAEVDRLTRDDINRFFKKYHLRLGTTVAIGPRGNLRS